MNTEKIILICLSILFFTCKEQPNKISSTEMRIEVQKIANEIASINVFTSEVINSDYNVQWINFENIYQLATEEELKILTEHNNGVVRCYAFQALANRKNADVFKILLQHLSDTMHIETLNGCRRGTRTVADCFVTLVTPYLVYPDSTKESEKHRLDSLFRIEYPTILTKEQKLIVDSILSSK